MKRNARILGAALALLTARVRMRSNQAAYLLTI